MNLDINKIDNNSAEEHMQKYSSVYWVEVEKIQPNPYQPRREFNDDSLKDLSESIRQYGVLQPLVVLRREKEFDNGTIVEYELIAGERRLRASKLAGLASVPVVIREDMGDKIKFELAIIENLQREDLNPIDRAYAFKKLVEEFSLKHHEVAKRVGKSRVFVTNTMRLLALPDEIQKGLVNGLISEGHTRALLTLTKNIEDQFKLYYQILDTNMNVRETERLSKFMSQKGNRDQTESLGRRAKEVEEKLSETFGTRVVVEKAEGSQRGRIHIDFFSEEDLNAFLTKVMGGEARNLSASEMFENRLADTIKSYDIRADEARRENAIQNGMESGIEKIKNNFNDGFNVGGVDSESDVGEEDAGLNLRDIATDSESAFCDGFNLNLESEGENINFGTEEEPLSGDFAPYKKYDFEDKSAGNFITEDDEPRLFLDEDNTSEELEDQIVDAITDEAVGELAKELGVPENSNVLEEAREEIREEVEEEIDGLRVFVDEPQGIAPESAQPESYDDLRRSFSL